jgi:hypothetical protein
MLIKKCSLLVASVLISGCSTVGGIYKKDDPEHGEFSMEKTVLTVIGAIGTAALMHNAPKDDESYDSLWWENSNFFGE